MGKMSRGYKKLLDDRATFFRVLKDLSRKEKVSVFDTLKTANDLEENIKKCVKEVKKALPLFEVGRDFFEYYYNNHKYEVYSDGRVKLYDKRFYVFASWSLEKEFSIEDIYSIERVEDVNRLFDAIKNYKTSSWDRYGGYCE